MRLLKLQLTILGTMGLLIGLSTLIFSIILLMLGGTYNIGFIIVLVGIFHFIQWIYGPKFVEKRYKVRELKKTDTIPCANPRVIAILFPYFGELYANAFGNAISEYIIFGTGIFALLQILSTVS